MGRKATSNVKWFSSHPLLDILSDQGTVHRAVLQAIGGDSFEDCNTLLETMTEVVGAPLGVFRSSDRGVVVGG